MNDYYFFAQKFSDFIVCSGNLEDTGSDELLNFSVDDWVTHGSLTSSGVLLHITKHLHDGWVAHDILDLRVSHGVGHALLIVAGRCMCIALNQLHRLSVAILALFVVLINLEALLEGFHRLVELFL